MRRICSALLCALTLAVLPTQVGAQPLWVNQEQNKLLSLEILKPGFDESLGSGFSTLTFFFSARQQLGENVLLVLDLPLAHYDDDETTLSESQTAIGNIYIGLEQKNEGGFGELGVRIPTLPDDSRLVQAVGTSSDLDRWEAWLNDVITVEGYGNYRTPGKTGAGARGRLGVSGWIPTKGGDAEAWIPYTLMGFFRDQGGEVSIGVTGRALITESNLSFDQRTVHQLVLAGHLNVGQVQLGAVYRSFLDPSVNEDVSYVFGLNVGVVLK